jgi:hypothetical protein
LWNGQYDKGFKKITLRVKVKTKVEDSSGLWQFTVPFTAWIAFSIFLPTNQ